MNNPNLPDECFVIMPFGRKPFGDGTLRTYDFEKVYRVLIKRAITQAGLHPVRADERVGSHMIHTEMFQDLRDRRVVLADLSLHNPNVFYELGVRHVMSDRGTVLLCEEKTHLPFDVGLSRVIHYSFDGEQLDWEEVERKVQEVQTALEQAKRGRPDSPVHALLESVLAGHLARRDHRGADAARVDEEKLDPFQQHVAETWSAEKRDAASLFKENCRSRFGLRSLAYFCLMQQPLPAESGEIARALFYLLQYDLAARLLERLESQGQLSQCHQLTYASAISEMECNLSGADRGLAMLAQAAERAFPATEKPGAGDKALLDAAECSYSLATMRVWRWHVSGDRKDLEAAITELSRALEFAELQGHLRLPIGRLAHTRLLILLLRRCQDGDRDRADTERHAEAILRLQPQAMNCDPSLLGKRAISYLQWYQAIVHADSGSGEPAIELALRTFSQDTLLREGEEYRDIGGRQYAHLRRFLEHHSRWLRNPNCIGRIAQILQSWRGPMGV